jgi:hypothetical protein
MKIRKRLPVLVAAAALLAGVSLPARAQPQNDAAAIAIGEKDIGGAVSGPHGREAGVWVIAETTELPTRFTRIIVTDDLGGYLVPDLPQADYSVWVAATVLSTLRRCARSQASGSISQPRRRLATLMRRITTRRSIGIPC